MVRVLSLWVIARVGICLWGCLDTEQMGAQASLTVKYPTSEWCWGWNSPAFPSNTTPVCVKFKFSWNIRGSGRCRGGGSELQRFNASRCAAFVARLDRSHVPVTRRTRNVKLHLVEGSEAVTVSDAEQCNLESSAHRVQAPLHRYTHLTRRLIQPCTTTRCSQWHSRIYGFEGKRV